MFHYSSLEYDTNNTIIPKDVHNTEDNSMMKHKSPSMGPKYE